MLCWFWCCWVLVFSEFWWPRCFRGCGLGMGVLFTVDWLAVACFEGFLGVLDLCGVGII